MALFNPSRDQVRQFFFDAWAKYRQRQPLSGLEAMALEVMQMHTEYHHVLDAPEHYLNQAYFPEMGETNPFLHMSLHLSILEQLSIDQPPGIRAAYQSLQQRMQDSHAAQHVLMECLAEVLWQAQRAQAMPDTEAYLALIRQWIDAAG
ncbi:MAG TPA: DUF1841 family protein [Methylophilaceae bacterium]|jgi:hypothetical protein